MKQLLLYFCLFTVICKFDVSLVVEEDVVELEVAVDDAALVQVVQRKTYLSRIKPKKVKFSARQISEE